MGSLGYVYKGSFNTIIVIASISMRLIAGRASDSRGRVPLMLIGGALLAVGMFGLSVAETKATAALFGVIYVMSIGINMPTIMAWTADLARPGKGRSGLGHHADVARSGHWRWRRVLGVSIPGDLSAISSLYAIAGGLGLFGFVVLLIFRKRVPDPQGEAVRAA